MRELAGDLSLLSVNTATLRKQLALSAVIEVCARRGIGGLSRGATRCRPRASHRSPGG
jgi:hypothetical protein